MQIREANRNDARRISYLIAKNTDKVLQNNYSADQKRIWKKVTTTNAIRQQLSDRTIFCGFENDRLVGTIALHGNQITGLYVSYSQRNKGLGRQLLAHLETYAKQSEITELSLTSTPSAVTFYLKNGYRSGGEVIVNIEGVPFHETKMTKQL